MQGLQPPHILYYVVYSERLTLWTT